MTNIYDISKPTQGDETLKKLFSNEKVRISAITSNTIENGGWYEQEEDEWFVLLEGEALLEIDGEIIDIKRGDTMFIPAFTLHRVKKTSATALWVTVHITT